MRKKNYLLIVIFLSLGSLLFFYSTKKKTPIIKENLSLEKKSTKKALKKIRQALPMELIENKNWDIVQDFSTNAKEALQILRKKKNYQKYLKTLFKKTYQCHKIDYCGTKPDKETGYFDPSETPSLKTMKRLLEMTQDDSLSFDEDILLDLSNSPNDKVATLALKHLLKKGAPLTKKILQKLGQSKGLTRAKTISLLLKKISVKDRASLFDEIIRGIKELPPYSTISLLESIQEQSFSQLELKEIAYALCPYHEKKDQNWGAIKYLAQSLLTKKNLAFRDYCSFD